MKVVVVGHVCIDHNLSEHASYTRTGSPAMFINKVFSKIPDCDVTVVSSYGPDFLDYANDLSLYPAAPNVPKTLVYENVSLGGTRSQKALNIENALEIEINSMVEEIISAADVLFIAPLAPTFSGKYVSDICKITRSKCLKILLPQGYFRNFDNEGNVVPRDFVEDSEVVSEADVVIFSEQDHRLAIDLAKKWLKEYGKSVLMTVAERGCVVFDRGNQYLVGTEPVSPQEIVDSVGSGDIFSASFAYYFVKTENLEGSVKFANKIARENLFRTSDNIAVLKINEI